MSFKRKEDSYDQFSQLSHGVRLRIIEDLSVFRCFGLHFFILESNDLQTK